jgi:hypothetical protein
MQTKARCFLSLGTAFTVITAIAADRDDIDRIVAAVGVDSMHSVDEEPRMRRVVAEALTEIRRKDSNANVPQQGTPEFDALVRQAIDDQQRMRRDPLVFAAYRTTLSQMLSPTELAQAAAFYDTPVGRKAHIAVIEAEKAAAVAMEEVGARQAK